ncbi:molybdopterin-dependent oxidoreductase [Novosphingobium sp.]|uniref:molybdopterin-containing oxidoreductase family protein n=1 Tax=Novosphingobium sp. TaxID=1874826 RepID=UPI0038BA3A78
MTQAKSSFCRICEPGCPLKVHFDEDGQPILITPDAENPAKGTACHKGLSYLEIHDDPDRLNWPMMRVNPRSEPRGEFVRVSWDTAFAEIGKRMRTVCNKHGAKSIATYAGNPGAFNSTWTMFAPYLRDALGTEFRFTSNTQDTSNKMATFAEVYGSAASFKIPDISNTDYLLCIGTNPKVSRWTLMSAENNWDIVKDIPRRGGKVRFVNPRVTESSTPDTGPTLLIKPGTDVYFLAALLHEIERINGFDVDIVRKYAKNVDDLRDFVKNYSADTVSAITGLSADSIRQVAHEFAKAKSGIVYMATGVNQSRQGMVAALLVEMLQLVTGNLGRKGGTYKPNGLTLACPPITGVKRIETSLGVFEVLQPGMSVPLPANIMSDLIANGDIKALFVISGNPVLTVAGEEAARKAYENLDLLISIDIFRSATGELADFVLPAADFLERQDINFIGNGLQQTPNVKYTEAMVSPAHERREDWWILSKILQASGFPSPFDDNPEIDWGTEAIEKILANKNLSIEKLKAMPSGTALLEQIPYDAFFEIGLQHADGKIDCFPKKFISAGLFDRFEKIFADLSREPEGMLKLISLRTPYMNNSWFANAPKFRKGKERDNPLHMARRDLDRLGLVDGERISLTSQFGSIETHVYLDESLREGVVAMAHGYGQARTFSQRIAQQNPGSNCNAIMPTGADSIEPLSNMAWLSAVPVSVRSIEFVDA